MERRLAPAPIDINRFGFRPPLFFLDSRLPGEVCWPASADTPFPMKRIIKADIDDMLFEDRERHYGSYLLRKQYLTTLKWVLVLMVSFGIMGIDGILWYGARQQKKMITKTEKSVIPYCPLDLFLPPPQTPKKCDTCNRKLAPED